ncbi:hypothetical protein QVH35_00130 [Candidatus Nitrosotenuis chungbukensis]|nr:hypothetical protein [Candidatus Nitrosotenuis chungbukensis]WKT57999.1 hypothetical protein QVH35_00130 [Candidatus Nitrosotenuis chungbukensis]
MERNISYVEKSDGLKSGARDLVKRSMDTAKIILQHIPEEKIVRPGRKAQHLTVDKEE